MARTPAATALIDALDAGRAADVRAALAAGIPPRAPVRDRDGLPDALCLAITGNQPDAAEALLDAGATCAGRTRDASRPLELLVARLTGSARRHDPVPPAPIAKTDRPAWIRLLLRLTATSLYLPAALAAGDARCWEHEDVFTALLAAGGLQPEHLEEAVFSLRPDMLERLLPHVGAAVPAADGSAALMRMMRGDLLSRAFEMQDTPRHRDLAKGARRARTAACVRLLASRRDIANPDSERPADPLVLALLAGLPELVSVLVAAGFAPDRVSSCQTRGFLPSQLGEAAADPQWSRINAPGVTPLTVAVRIDEAAGATALLDAGADANLADGEGVTPLAWAERLGRTAIATLLARRGATARAAGSPLAQLIAACEAADADQVRTLLAAGAPVDGKLELARSDGRAEWTPLLAAVRADAGAVTALLLAAGADPGQRLRDTSWDTTTPFLVAAATGRAGQLVLMLPKLADRTQRLTSLDPTAGKGDDALTLAAGSGKAEAVRVLLDAGWKAGGDAVHAAIAVGDFASARLLVERGAKPDALDSVGSPPLTAAINLLGEHNRTDGNDHGLVAQPEAIDAFVRFLLDHGAKPDLRANQKGTRPLCAASAKGRRDWVELLLGRGAAIEPPFGHLGTTPLMEAAINGQAELIPVLLARGADIHRRAPDGHGVVWRACCSSGSAARILPMLLAAGADPNHGDHDGRTPLDVLLQGEDAADQPAIALLRTHGGKCGKDLAKAQPSQPAAREEPPLDFTGQVDAAFRKACAIMAKAERFTWQDAADIPGTLLATVPSASAGRILDPAAAAARLKRGLLVVGDGARAVPNEQTTLRAIPSRDWADALRCAGTNGCNYDLMNDDVIRWLRKLEAEQPFILTAVAHDLIEGRFSSPIAKPKAMARRMYRFCPDLVDQGCGTVDRLAKELAGETPRLYFWWD